MVPITGAGIHTAVAPSLAHLAQATKGTNLSKQFRAYGGHAVMGGALVQINPLKAGGQLRPDTAAFHVYFNRPMARTPFVQTNFRHKHV
jgi:hypothetical protein